MTGACLLVAVLLQQYAVTLVWDVSYVPCVQGHSWSRPEHIFKLPHLHVLWWGSLIGNIVKIILLLEGICVKRLLQLTATSFISVIIVGAT